jgi:ubiquinone/menaquinone biosynthesis C-methylase UbiE
MEDNSIVSDFYESYNEDERIIRDPLEFIRTKEIISRYLPETPIKIIDLCGASGHYAYWLAEKGHEVHLMDLSQKHINRAKNNQLKYKTKLASMICGDARSLEYENESFDMVLLMGALYHLQEKEDRMQCLKEVHRILKKGGIAIFAYISRFASMIDGFKNGYINDPIFCDIMDKDILTGRHNNPENKLGYFTNAYFHSTNDVNNELINAKFCGIKLYAVEGFGSMINDEEYIGNCDKLQKLLHYIRITEQDMEMVGISGHWLVICNKNV